MDSGYELPGPDDPAQTDHPAGRPPWLNVVPYPRFRPSGAGR